MFKLDVEARFELFQLARTAIRHYLAHNQSLDYSPRHEGLRQSSGAFVSLKQFGQLRGCIGSLAATRPLHETIISCAIAAAVQDPRFEPLRAEELSQVTLEVTLLSPSRPIAGPSEILIGTHGLIVSRGEKRGVLLPQVALEHHWDRETFLSQTCLKAGLLPDGWRRENALIEIFTADIYSELELSLPLDA